MKVKRKMNESAQSMPIAPQQEPTQPDEAFTQAARARLLVDAEKKAREQRCGQEIDAAVTEIARRNRCAIKFMELREGGNTVRLWLQPVAQDEPTTQ